MIELQLAHVVGWFTCIYPTAKVDGTFGSRVFENHISYRVLPYVKWDRHTFVSHDHQPATFR